MNELIEKYINEFSTPLNYNNKETVIILAAGHGKRIKSQTSKMLHKIWGVPTVERVHNACKKAFKSFNTVQVVGIKAEDVISVINKRENTVFAYQEQQNGTGHAVQVGLEKIDHTKYDGTVYVLPGDMGLINDETIKMFKDEFDKSGLDMMVLTGLYEGKTEENYYGRIIRVKDKDINGTDSGNNFGKVIEIIEFKDIQKLPDDKPYILDYNGNKYSYTKNELLENNEFNSSVYAFKYKPLIELINTIESNNAQNEIYITDLISIFNKNGYSVGAVSPKDQYVLLGFNNKSVLMEMEKIARDLVYNKIKDIIEIDDPDDFYIHENVIDEIVEIDKKGAPLDIHIGKGAYIGNGVKLNFNLSLKKNVFVDGNVVFGKNVTVWENVLLSCYPNQTLELKDGVEILWGDIIKGNIVIDEGARIESSVNVTGSDEHPTRIGKKVLIKGTSYIFGSVIEDEIFIEHSVLINKHVERIVKKNGKLQSVKFFLPMPEGIDCISDS